MDTVDMTCHYNDVKMIAVTSKITCLTIVYSTVYSGADQGKHQISASLAFVRGIHRWPMNSSHKGSITRKCFHLMTSSWFWWGCSICSFWIPVIYGSILLRSPDWHWDNRNILQWRTSQWAPWGLRSPASRSFTQPFVPAPIKENITARVTGLC